MELGGREGIQEENQICLMKENGFFYFLYLSATDKCRLIFCREALGERGQRTNGKCFAELGKLFHIQVEIRVMGVLCANQDGSTLLYFIFFHISSL